MAATLRPGSHMDGTLRLSFDASYTIALMASVGIVSGFATAG
jgi:hypothetical protein